VEKRKNTPRKKKGAQPLMIIGFNVSKIINTPLKRKVPSFRRKRGFDVSKIRNTTLKRKRAQPLTKKEALVFQK
jgi:hypothetical protein